MLDPGPELVERLDRRLGHGAAGLAHQMLVALLGEVVDDRAVGHVDVLHHAEIGEEIEGPVDGCAVEPRIEIAHRGGDVRRGQVLVVVGVDEDAEDRSAGARDTLAVRTERRDDAIEAILRHGGEATRVAVRWRLHEDGTRWTELAAANRSLARHSLARRPRTPRYAALPRAVVVVDQDGVIAHANPAAAQLFARPAATLAGTPMTELLPDGYVRLHDDLVRRERAAAPPAAVSTLVEGVRGDGSPIPLQVALGWYETADGVAVVAVLDAAPDGADAAVRLAVLEALVEMSRRRGVQPRSGRPRVELEPQRRAGVRLRRRRGRRARDVTFFPEHLRRELGLVFDTVFAGDHVSHFETEVRRKDGMPVPISLSASPVLDAGNRLLGAVLVARDITEQQLAQATLAEIETLMRESEALAHVGAWLWDVESGVVQWSDEVHRIHGVDPLDFEGTLDAHLERVHPDDADVLRSTMHDAVATGRALRRPLPDQGPRRRLAPPVGSRGTHHRLGRNGRRTARHDRGRHRPQRRGPDGDAPGARR